MPQLKISLNRFCESQDDEFASTSNIYTNSSSGPAFGSYCEVFVIMKGSGTLLHPSLDFEKMYKIGSFSQ
ncbi:hypothetical protein XELAEV_18039508mg [Xenopus laevis]|uniref:Uncharacterized protein n=1 Tax=Xenopus laevis TaxID=8355 RepID=A0A974C8U5_XENLA|nr:hypothetical protein XELAEV_18039508mg [Xenopus laevis]